MNKIKKFFMWFKIPKGIYCYGKKVCPYWQHKHPEFYKHIKNFMRKGKNLHDDGADVLTAIAESINNKPKIMVSKSRII